MKILRTGSMEAPSLVLCIYGPGGVGKTTLASTAPKPIILDSEEGVKAFRARGIDIPYIPISTWKEVCEAWKLIRETDDFDTVVIDPVGVFMNILIEEVKGGGSMNIGKWGTAKDRMRKFIWAIKSSGKHAVFVAHEEHTPDEDKILRGPKMATKLSSELVDMCDVVGHLRVGEGGVRELLVQPTDKWTAKDRYDAFGTILENPNVAEMITTIHAKYQEPPFKE